MTTEQIIETMTAQGHALKAMHDHLDATTKLMFALQKEVMHLRKMEKVTERHLEMVQKQLWQGGPSK